MAHNEMKLRIESVSGSPINDYRIKDGHVQVRSLSPSGSAFPENHSAWRTLDEGDIQLHHALKTVVSEWLRLRFSAAEDEDNVLKKAA